MNGQGSVKWAFETNTVFGIINLRVNQKEHPTPSLATKRNTNWTQDLTTKDTNAQNNNKAAEPRKGRQTIETIAEGQ